jgi:hypothetical protein
MVIYIYIYIYAFFGGNNNVITLTFVKNEKKNKQNEKIEYGIREKREKNGKCKKREISLIITI